MRTLTAKGIIVKETKSGEADKFITVLLKDYGKMTVFCKGARNTKSKFLASTSLFSYCEFVIFTGAKTPSLLQIDLIESFYNIRLDYDTLSYASYFTEISDKLILSDVNCDDHIRLLYVAFKNLTKENANIDLVKVTFELKFLELMGMYPAHNFCGCCNEEVNELSGKVFFDINGLLCYNCRQNHLEKSILIDNSFIYILNYILNTDISKVFNYTISEHTINLLSNATTLFIRGNIAENFKSMSFMLGK